MTKADEEELDDILKSMESSLEGDNWKEEAEKLKQQLTETYEK